MPTEAQTAETFASGLQALVHVPPGPAPSEGWPFILFLHGAGERGRRVDRVRVHGIPKVVDRDPAFPFVTVSPQCPPGRWWGELVPDLVDGLDQAVAAHPVDRSRVYLTGLSMGGYGAWALAARHPDRFAAMVAVCGGGHPDWAPQLANLPIKVFHGTADTIVPVSESVQMVQALEALGAPVELVLYQGVAHDSWTRTFDDPELYRWLLAHRRA